VRAARPVPPGYTSSTNAVNLNPGAPGSSFARLWIDGLERDSVSQIPGAQFILNSGDAPCVAAECSGCGLARLPADHYFDGSIVEVEVLNYALWARVVNKPLAL